MSDDIEILDQGELPTPTELLVQVPQAGGWFGFSTTDGNWWMLIYPTTPLGTVPDTRRFPHPLFQSKDELIETAKKSLPHGGKIKFWKVTL